MILIILTTMMNYKYIYILNLGFLLQTNNGDIRGFKKMTTGCSVVGELSECTGGNQFFLV